MLKSVSPENAGPGASSYPTEPPFYGTKLAQDSWQFAANMRAPKKVTVRVLSVAGKVITEQESTLDI
jgi:hypothetical protein